MKGRESGMPDESMWAMFFEPQLILKKLGLRSESGDVVEFGSGYGTFTIPAARIVRGMVHALDIEPEMLAITQTKAEAAGLNNVRLYQRDFIADGSGLQDASVDFAMLFNILHVEEPLQLLREAYRILAPGGNVGIIHWNYDPKTPRGPSMDIRPRPAQCIEWIEAAGFSVPQNMPMDFPPYHYGLVGMKSAMR